MAVEIIRNAEWQLAFEAAKEKYDAVIAAANAEYDASFNVSYEKYNTKWDVATEEYNAACRALYEKYNVEMLIGGTYTLITLDSSETFAFDGMQV